MKNDTEVTFNLSSNVIGGFNDGANFPYNFLLTDTQVSKLLQTVCQLM